MSATQYVHDTINVRGMNIVKFIAYNNTVPIVLGILFLSSGLVFAANDEVREFVVDSVYQAEQSLVSVDNSYIANKNLDVYSPKVNISNVTEDDDFYYVTYIFTTISLEDDVWQDVAQEKVMQVSKNALGKYVDLGVYVTEQLKQLVEREIAYLQEVQGIEKKLVTNKVVATAYSGLVGQLIDDSTEELPGYTPQVFEPVVEEVDPIAVAKAQKSDAIPFDFEAAAANNSNSNNNGNTDATVGNSGPVITVLGANPARIPLGSSYSDLGAVTLSQDGVTLGLSVTLYVNSEEVSSVNIDTSTVADWSVGYSATDQDGNEGFAERVVIVYDPNAVEETPAETSTTTATTTATTTQEQTTPDDTTATSTEETSTETQATSTQSQATDTTTSSATSTEEATSPPAEEEIPTSTATSTES